MRILVALGGNALLKRGEPMTAEVQRANVRTAARRWRRWPGPPARDLPRQRPQVGLLALQAAAYKEVEAYPLDVLGAQTEGMIGYLIEQELGNLLPAEVPFATLLTMIEVDPTTPASPTPPSSSARSTATPRPRRWRPTRAGCSSATASTCAGSSLAPPPADLRDPPHPVAARARASS